MARNTDRSVYGNSPSVAHTHALENIREALQKEADRINADKARGMTASVEYGWRGPRIVVVPKCVNQRNGGAL